MHRTPEPVKAEPVWPGGCGARRPKGGTPRAVFAWRRRTCMIPDVVPAPGYPALRHQPDKPRERRSPADPVGHAAERPGHQRPGVGPDAGAAGYPAGRPGAGYAALWTPRSLAAWGGAGPQDPDTSATGV